MKSCDICIEEECKGKKQCDCENCKHKLKCNKKLSPIIRITKKCTQSCSHCCFNCSPQINEHMSIESAQNIANFLQSNEITTCTIMGGEFFCNPDWIEIFQILISKVNFCRLVTNGDWAIDETVIKEISSYNDKMHIAISEDKWHTNVHTKKAKELCEKYNFSMSTPTNEMQSDIVLVPAGRLEWQPIGIYGMFATYCSNPLHHYSFLIDEVGDIFKCGFGTWDYANVNDYLNGNFALKFKEFNQFFYKQFISSCKSCIRMYKSK